MLSQETRESFISMSARREGYLPTGDITAADPLVRSNMASHGVEAEGKRRQASESRQVHSPKSITMASRSHPPASLVPRSLPENARAPSSPGTGGEFVIAGQGAPPPHELTSAPKGSAAMSGEGEAGGLYADNSCSVCLDDYTEGDELLQLTCGHVFHRPCIDLWLKGHCICPTCRCGGSVGFHLSDWKPGSHLDRSRGKSAVGGILWHGYSMSEGTICN